MLEPDSGVSASVAKNIAAFLTRLKTYESDNPDVTISDVLNWLDLSILLGESPLVNSSDYSPDDHSVKILTVHSSKGLEFSTIFMVNLVSDRFPSRNRSEELPVPTQLIKESRPELDFHIQEERRLFYVGLTRARDNIFLSYADYYGDGKRLKKPSPFIAETLGPSTFNIQHPTFGGATPATGAIESTEDTASIKVPYLTYSHIDTFLTCPLHYKAKYVLGLPTAPSPSLSLGSSVHRVLRSLGEGGKTADIIKLLKQNWILEGYSSIEHRDQSFSHAYKFLTEFAKLYPKIHPLRVEYAFKFSLGSGLTIGGRFDRIDQNTDGSIHIIDYKTSAKPKTQKDADKDLQLSIYALAASKVFNLPPDKIQLSFYFFETQSFVTTTRTKLQLDAAAQDVLAIRDQIQASDFSCSHSFVCQSCEYSQFCATKTTS
jgi:DNA helicase-2/ATP-dependent DNA helicase PcrA